MRGLVAGATGVIGRPLVTAPNAHGHAVARLTHHAERVDLLSGLGAQPLVASGVEPRARTAASRSTTTSGHDDGVPTRPAGIQPERPVIPSVEHRGVPPRPPVAVDSRDRWAVSGERGAAVPPGRADAVRIPSGSFRSCTSQPP